MADMTATCARCPNPPPHALLVICKACQEAFCPQCWHNGGAEHVCTPGDAVATGAARHVKWPPVPVAGPVRAHDDWEDM